eukprot:1488465-Rhodomonas_salina.3
MALYAEGEESHGAFVVRKGRVAVELLGARLESMQDARCVGFEALFTGRVSVHTHTHALRWNPCCVPDDIRVAPQASDDIVVASALLERAFDTQRTVTWKPTLSHKH